MPKFGKKKKNSEDDAGAMTSDFDFPSEEEAESEEEGVPGLEIIDEDGQEAVDPPKRYMALRKMKLNIRSERDSEEVGGLEKGHVVLATHTKVQDGITRLRCERGSPFPGKGTAAGWVSLHKEDGSLCFIAEDCENRVYKVTADTATVRAGPGRTDQKTKEALQKNMIFECLDVKEEAIPGNVNKYKALQFKIGGSTGLEGDQPSHSLLFCALACAWQFAHGCVTAGWTAEKSLKGEKWCTRQEFVDVEGDKELKKVGKLKQKEDKKDAKKAAAEETAAKKKADEEEKAAKKQADKAQKEVRAFEAKLIALMESVPDSEPHPLDPKALDLLEQAVKKIAEQTSEWAAEEPEPEPEQ